LVFASFAAVLAFSFFAVARTSLIVSSNPTGGSYAPGPFGAEALGGVRFRPLLTPIPVDTWGVGCYEDTAAQLAPVSDVAVAALGLSKGAHVLDEGSPTPLDWGDPAGLRALLGVHGDVEVSELQLAQQDSRPEGLWDRWERLHPV